MPAGPIILQIEQFGEKNGKGVALACPAQRAIIRIHRGRGRPLELREPNATPYKIDSDPDSDPDPELLSHFVGEFINGTPERLSLSRSHDHRPWV